MVIDFIENLIQNIPSDKISIIQQHIEKVKKNEVEIGKWYFLEHEIKAIALNKSGFVTGKFESHKIYKDLHIVIEGEDNILLANPYNSTVAEAYNEKDDFTIFNSDHSTIISMCKNSFALINCGEIHTNNITSNNTIKLVFKLKA